MEYSSDLYLGQGLCIFTSFHFYIPNFIFWTVLIFILIYFEWRDTENQQYIALHITAYNAWIYYMQCTNCTHNLPYIDIHVQYCLEVRSGKILFTTCTGRQVAATRHTELSSGKCILSVDWGRQSKLSSCTSGQVVSTRQTELWSAKRHLICSLKQRSYMSQAKEQARYRLCMPRSLKIRHKPLEGTSVRQTVYASFFKQRSNLSHAKVI